MRTFPSVWLDPQSSRGDAADDMEQDTAMQSFGHAKSKTHEMVCQWVAQELIREEATSLAMLAMELATADTVETHTLTCPIAQCGALGLREEFYVNSTTIRANGECQNLSQEADQQELVELQQKERPEIISHFSVLHLLQKMQEEDT